MNRLASFALSLTAAALLSACVFAPPAGSSNALDADAIAKNSVGNVREVNAKSFTCK
jgi:hypothetical protein